MSSMSSTSTQTPCKVDEVTNLLWDAQVISNQITDIGLRQTRLLFMPDNGGSRDDHMRALDDQKRALHDELDVIKARLFTIVSRR